MEYIKEREANRARFFAAAQKEAMRLLDEVKNGNFNMPKGYFPKGYIRYYLHRWYDETGGWEHWGINGVEFQITDTEITIIENPLGFKPAKIIIKTNL